MLIIEYKDTTTTPSVFKSQPMLDYPNFYDQTKIIELNTDQKYLLQVDQRLLN